MAYTTINKSSDFFNTKLYTGTGSSQSITGVGHQPDFVWIKQRSGNQFHQLANVIQGVGKQLCANANETESTDANGLTAFGTDGFSVGSSGNYNNNGGTFVSWNWKAGGGQGSSNTAGSINTTYTSVNTTAGFSISKYSGNTTAGATIGHGLGAVPKMIIIKNLNSAENWVVYHSSLGATKFLSFNRNDAVSTSSGVFNNTEPTSSLISLGDFGSVNESPGIYVAYAFAEKTGYSKFGSYTGNGNADGTFVYTGFKPAWVILKRTDDAGGYPIIDVKRDTYNPSIKRLTADISDQEYNSINPFVDILSNGFKLKTDSSFVNHSGGSFIYMAFGQSLVGSNNVPCTAR